MKSIPIGQLRQNPTAALDAVERGESLVVTRHRREVARLVPVSRKHVVTPAAFEAALRRTPVDAGWEADLKAARRDFDGGDPWAEA